MTASTIAFTQGLTAQGFDVIDHRGYGADGTCVSASAVARGDFMIYTGKNIVSVCSGGIGSVAGKYAGFSQSKVVAAVEGLRIDYAGQLALINSDKISLWRVGRFRVTNVVGVVADGVLVYPGTVAGSLQSAKVGTDLPVGVAREGNGGVSGGAIIVECNLLGAL